MVTYSLIYPEQHWFKTADQSETRISCVCKQTRAGCVVVSGPLTASHLSAVDFNDVVWPSVCVVRWAAQVAARRRGDAPAGLTLLVCVQKKPQRDVCFQPEADRVVIVVQERSTETHFNVLTTFYSRINKYSEETWSWRLSVSPQVWCHIWESRLNTDPCPCYKKYFCRFYHIKIMLDLLSIPAQRHFERLETFP